MKLYPQDLSQKAYTRLIQWRTCLNIPGIKSGDFDRSLQLHLSGPKSIVAVGNILYFCFMAGWMGYIASPHDGYSVLFGTIPALIGFPYLFIKARQRRKRILNGSLELQEIALFSKKEIDPLVQSYFQTVIMLMTLPTPADDLTCINIRSALQQLGAAIDDLPMEPAQNIFTDRFALQEQAVLLKNQAAAESDEIIALSLERQAAALLERSETISLTETLLRRNAVLRDEVSAQVKSFQTSIAASQVSGRMTNGDFEALAERITQVALQANALVRASAELYAAAPPAEQTPETWTIGIAR